MSRGVLPAAPACVALVVSCAGASGGAGAAQNAQSARNPQSAQGAPVDAGDLRLECGRIERTASGALHVDSACLRAVVGDKPRAGAAIRFTYRGPSASTEPLASGEVRRQIGLKLRARDTCNVVYVMWHVAPTSGVHVSVKSNPGLRDHAACGDRGYDNLRPRSGAEVAPIRPGEPHTLEARVDGDELRVVADGAAAWSGALPAEAFAFDGPVGVRSDNGEFDFALTLDERPALARAER